MGIALVVPADAPEVTADLAPLAPTADGQPVKSGGVTLAVCARVADPRPDDLRLCRKATRKGKDGADDSTVWRPTSRVLDISRAVNAGLLTVALPETAAAAA